ncbi:MAG: mechanosensitive ion channel [Candidatus Cloacimonetes bacterium]|nr:mechanosensitive ion channel [Candidatus Cloacimonadota bacterium]
MNSFKHAFMQLYSLVSEEVLKFYHNLFQVHFVVQFFLGALVLGLAYILSRILRKKIVILFSRIPEKTNLFLLEELFPVLGWFFVLILDRGFIMMHLPHQVVHILLNLMLLLMILRLVVFFIDNILLKRIIMTVTWTIAILSSIGLWEQTRAILNSASFTLIGFTLTLYTVSKAALAFLVFGWLFKQISTFLENRIAQANNIKPTLQVLLAKLVRFLLGAAVFFIVIGNLGINLTAFAVFSGTLGIGIGFGLQKIASNLVSGIILLLDDSIKPGDIIETEGVTGYVKTMGTRYTSVVAFDGREILIPNEMLITNTVINWSHSTNLVRLQVDVGVAYKEDPHKVQQLLLEVPNKIERILSRPKVECFLMDFADSSVNFRLVFWIKDPRKGYQDVRSDVMLGIWDTFKANNIEIPFPQQDIYIKENPLASR